MTRPWTLEPPPSDDVAEFVEGPGVMRLPEPRFDIVELRRALDAVVAAAGYDDSEAAIGLGVLPVTRRPGTAGLDRVDLSGRYWTRPDESYQEVTKEELVDEAAYTELVPEFRGTYFEHVLDSLRGLGTIGRVRLNLKQPFNTNSWHRDPEPRLHLPIYTNPGCIFIVNHHATHLPADGSLYFTDTRGYHTALNGGAGPRVHLVAAIVP